MSGATAFRTGGAPPDWRERLSAFSGSSGCTAVLVREEVVEGMVHVASAVEHAQRAFSEDRNRSRDLEVEVILYLTGERRIERALRIAGPADVNVLIVVSDDPDDAAGALDALGVDGGLLPRLTENSSEAIERTALLDIAK